MKKNTRRILAMLITAILVLALSPMVAFAATSADLAVTAIVDNAVVEIGRTVIFTVTATNNSSDTASDITVNCTVPAGLTIVTAIPSTGSVSKSGQTVTWSLGSFSNASRTLAITCTATTLGAKTLTATISATDNVDPTQSNDTSSVDFSVTPPAPTASSPQDFRDDATVADLVAQVGQGYELVWYGSGNNLLDPTDLLIDGATYTAKASYNSIESSGTDVTVNLHSPPAVSSVSVPADGTYTLGQTLNFTVNYPVNITVDTAGGTPRIPLTIGGGTVYASYISGSGTSALTFSYTVGASQYGTNLALGTSIDLNGGTIMDPYGNDALLTLNSVGSLSNVVVDGRSAANSITAFNIPLQVSSSITGTSISVVMPHGTDLTSLTPQITVSADATVSPTSGTAQDFSSPVQYIVTAQNGDTKTYTVTVTEQGPPAAVGSVSISPKTVSVEKGKTQAFTVAVDATGGATQAVTWGVDGTDSSISSAGLLTVGANETASMLTVTATSDFDGTTKDTATVTVTSPAGQQPGPVTIIDRPDAGKPLDLAQNAVFGFSGEYSQLAWVKLNGNLLTETPVDNTLAKLSGYPGYSPMLGDVKSGSTIVTLYKDFLQWLPDGKYTLEVGFLDGSIESMGGLDFEIKRDSTTATDSTSPQTGDGANLNLWIALCMMAGVAIMYFIRRRQKA